MTPSIYHGGSNHLVFRVISKRVISLCRVSFRAIMTRNPICLFLLAPSSCSSSSFFLFCFVDLILFFCVYLLALFLFLLLIIIYLYTSPPSILSTFPHYPSSALFPPSPLPLTSLHPPLTSHTLRKTPYLFSLPLPSPPFLPVSTYLAVTPSALLPFLPPLPPSLLRSLRL